MFTSSLKSAPEAVNTSTGNKRRGRTLNPRRFTCGGPGGFARGVPECALVPSCEPGAEHTGSQGARRGPRSPGAWDASRPEGPRGVGGWGRRPLPSGSCARPASLFVGFSCCDFTSRIFFFAVSALPLGLTFEARIFPMSLVNIIFDRFLLRCCEMTHFATYILLSLLLDYCTL